MLAHGEHGKQKDTDEKIKEKSKHNLNFLAIHSNNNLAFNQAGLLCCFFPFLCLLLDSLVINQISKDKKWQLVSNAQSHKSN
jgi:hypothetical protein